MQILFVHPNYPAQFGPVLSRLSRRPDVECFFASRRASGLHDGVQCIRYKAKGGATRSTHYCSRTFENSIWQTQAVHEACKAETSLRPDLIVGHSGFGTTLFLRELYDCPILSFFEYFYRAHGTDMDFRPEFPPREIDFLRSRARNATLLLDLNECDAGYTPTQWQHSLLPEVYRPKVDVIHDGIDTELWCRRDVPRRLGDEEIGDDVRIVTFVARGLEAMRGFDVFVRVAKQIAAALPSVVFAVVGDDRVHYGNDQRFVARGKSFREHVLEQEQPDLDRFRFLGRIPQRELADLLSMSDLHLYCSVPFVLSWSMLDAMACECVVLASDVAPVREVIAHGENGLLGDFFDEEGLAAQALEVLHDPARFRPLATAARRCIEERYSLDHTYPQLERLFERVARG